MDNIKTFTKAALVEDLREIVDMGWIKNRRKGNVGGIGNTLEDLLGIEENNLPIPNATEWELKTQRLNSTALITLFHIEPSPTAIKFVPRIFLPSYGWPHEEAGKKYPSNEMSFRQTINGLSRSDRGFMIQVKRPEQKIVVSFDHKAVNKRHETWLKGVKKRIGLGELEPQPYWGFEDISEKTAAKLHNCFYIQAEVKKERGSEYYKYTSVTMLKGFNFEGFLHGLETSRILVDFDARTGHNHGTKFRMRQSYFPNLYKTMNAII